MINRYLRQAAVAPASQLLCRPESMYDPADASAVALASYGVIERVHAVEPSGSQPTRNVCFTAEGVFHAASAA